LRRQKGKVKTDSWFKSLIYNYIKYWVPESGRAELEVRD